MNYKRSTMFTIIDDEINEHIKNSISVNNNDDILLKNIIRQLLKTSIDNKGREINVDKFQTLK